MTTSLRQFARDIWVLPRSIKILGAGLGLGVVYGVVALLQAGAGQGMVIPLIATASAAVLLSLAIGWIARRIARVRSRGIALALWDRMTRRGTSTTKAAAQAQRELQQRWRDVHALLESKNYDYYALPWYLIVGASQSGKTTLVQRSGQEFPIGDQPIAEFGSTKNCNWFFTNKAILIDTAGRYVDHRLEDEPGPEERENEAEWKQFLALLRRHRPRTPLNGVILVVKVPDVLSPDAAVRRRTGEMLRDAMRDVETHLGIRCPVYVMVTMCDRVLGFADFFRSLGGMTDRSLLGWSRGGAFDAAFAPDEFQGALGGLLRRLRELRLELLRDQRGSAVDPPDTGALDRLYAFPEEFAALTEAVREVLAVAFAPSAYHQTQFFRGVYFTSSLQKGAPFHEICRALLGDADAARVPPGGPVEPSAPAPDSKTYFVADFFDEKVFREVGLVVPTARAERRRRVAARAGIVAAAASVLLVLGCAIRDVRRTDELVKIVLEPVPTDGSVVVINRTTEVAPVIAGLAGESPGVDLRVVDGWTKTIGAVTKMVVAALDDAEHAPHADTVGLVAVLVAEAHQLPAALKELRRGSRAEDLSAGNLEAIHAGLGQQRKDLLDALTRTRDHWLRQVGELNSDAAGFSPGANRAAWRSLVLSHLATEVEVVGKNLVSLIEDASADQRSPQTLAEGWRTQAARLTTLKSALAGWAKEPETTSITTSFQTVEAAIAQLSGPSASAGPQLRANDTREFDKDLVAKIAAAEPALTSLGDVVGFDPEASPLATSEVWALANWTGEGLPPGFTLPTCSAQAHPALADVITAAEKRVNALATHIGHALLDHFAKKALLPLADHPVSSVDVRTGAQTWAKSQFARSSIAKARAVFANLQRFATGNSTRSETLQSASTKYEERFRHFWSDDLPTEIYKPARPTTVDAARALLQRDLPLPGRWIQALGVPTDPATERASPAIDPLEAFVDNLYSRCPWRETYDVADKLRAVSDKWRDDSAEHYLAIALGGADALRAPSRLRAGQEPLRKALQAYARDLQAALGVLAYDVLRRNWVAPHQISATEPPFPIDGGRQRATTEGPWVISPDVLDTWLGGPQLCTLSQHVWPALNPASSAYELFTLDQATADQRTCFVHLMQLRDLLIRKEPIQVTLSSLDRADAHSLKEAGELGIVVNNERQRVSPNNFARAIETVLASTDVRFEFKRATGEPWLSVPCTRTDASHFRLLLLLYSPLHDAKGSAGHLTCRIRLRALGPIDHRAEHSLEDVTRWNTADGPTLTFRARVTTRDLRFPDRLPDLSKAGFFEATPAAPN